MTRITTAWWTRPFESHFDGRKIAGCYVRKDRRQQCEKNAFLSGEICWACVTGCFIQYDAIALIAKKEGGAKARRPVSLLWTVRVSRNTHSVRKLHRCVVTEPNRTTWQDWMFLSLLLFEPEARLRAKSSNIACSSRQQPVGFWGSGLSIANTATADVVIKWHNFTHGYW